MAVIRDIDKNVSNDRFGLNHDDNFYNKHKKMQKSSFCQK